MKRWIVRLVTTAVLLLVVAGCDWSQVGMNAGHNLYDPSEPALTASTVGTLNQKFSLSVANASNAAPIVAGGRLFFSSFDSSTSTAELHAFDAATGAVLWSTTLATDATGVSDPVYDNGTIYTVTSTASGATTNALAAATGATAWSVALPVGFSLASSLVVDHGKVFVPMWQPGTVFAPWGTLELAALDESTGATVWTWVGQGPVSQGFRAAPAVGGGYVALMYGCCVKVGNPAGYPITELVAESNGSALTNSLNAGLNNGAEVDMTTVANGLLYGPVNILGAEYLAAYDPGTVDSGWDNPAWLIPASTGPFAVSNRSIIGAGANGLTALDAKTGASQWTTPLPAGSSTIGSPVIAGNLVYLVTADATTSTLRTFDAVTGAAVSSLNVGSIGPTATPVVVANGFVYITNGSTITAYAPA